VVDGKQVIKFKTNSNQGVIKKIPKKSILGEIPETSETPQPETPTSSVLNTPVVDKNPTSPRPEEQKVTSPRFSDLKKIFNGGATPSLNVSKIAEKVKEEAPSVPKEDPKVKTLQTSTFKPRTASKVILSPTSTAKSPRVSETKIPVVPEKTLEKSPRVVETPPEKKEEPKKSPEPQVKEEPKVETKESPIVQEKIETQSKVEPVVLSMKSVASHSIDESSTKSKRKPSMTTGIRKLSVIKKEREEEKLKRDESNAYPIPSPEVITASTPVSSPHGLLSPEPESNKPTVRRASITMGGATSVKSVKSKTASIKTVGSISMRKVSTAKLETSEPKVISLKASPRSPRKFEEIPQEIITIETTPAITLENPKEFVELIPEKPKRKSESTMTIPTGTVGEYKEKLLALCSFDSYTSGFKITDENFFISVFEDTKAYESFGGKIDRSSFSYSPSFHKNPTVFYSESETKTISTVFVKTEAEDNLESIQYGPGWSITQNILYDADTKTGNASTQKSYMVSEIFDNFLETSYVSLKYQDDEIFTVNEEFFIYNQKYQQSSSTFEQKENNISIVENNLPINFDFLDEEIKSNRQERQNMKPLNLVNYVNSTPSLTPNASFSKPKLENVNSGSGKKLHQLNLNFEIETVDDLDEPSPGVLSPKKKSFMQTPFTPGGLFNNSSIWKKSSPATQPLDKNRKPSMLKEPTSDSKLRSGSVAMTKKSSFRDSLNSSTLSNASFSQPISRHGSSEEILSLKNDENPNVQMVREAINLDSYNYDNLNPFDDEIGFISVAEDFSSYSNKQGNFTREFNYNHSNQEINTSAVVFYNLEMNEVNILELIKTVKSSKTDLKKGLFQKPKPKATQKSPRSMESSAADLQYSPEDIVTLNPLYDPYAKSVQEMAFLSIHQTIAPVLLHFEDHHVNLKNGDDDMLSLNEQMIVDFRKFLKSPMHPVSEDLDNKKSFHGWNLFGDFDPSSTQLKKTGTVLK
jgi:hypothetical protein